MATPVVGAETTTVTEVFARDQMITWFRGELAVANAIIDWLCEHLKEIRGSEDYAYVLEAIRQRRLNWIPVLRLQDHASVANIADGLRQVAARCAAGSFAGPSEEPAAEGAEEDSAAAESADDGALVSLEGQEAAPAMTDGEGFVQGSSDRNPVDDGEANGVSEEVQASLDPVESREDFLVRPERIKILKGFVAKESFKGHTVNVVKGLKLYEDILTELELLNVSEYLNELRHAGRRGELSGDTFILFNKEVKGNKTEMIQFGVPLFQSPTAEASSNGEPIPPELQAIIDHLVEWRLLPESKKPNSCLINFFDEEEHSQPFIKPPHFDNPISTFVLSETTMTFGRSVVSDLEGNYKGSLTLQIKQGTLLVMRGNSADVAQHVVCSSSNRRAIVTFVSVRTSHHQQVDSPAHQPAPLLQPTQAMIVWQPPCSPPPQPVPPAGAFFGWPHRSISPAWGFGHHGPYVVLPPRRAMAPSSSSKASRGGTGVFLPWVVASKKYTKNLPPRFQKARMPSMPSPLEAHA